MQGEDVGCRMGKDHGQRGAWLEIHQNNHQPSPNGRRTLHWRAPHPVSTIAGMPGERMSDEEIVQAFPDLELEDIEGIKEALLQAAEAA